MEQILNIEIIEPKIFSFKEYYGNNPEFRAKHIQYMSQHIECTCGQSIIRSYKSRHMRTPAHNKRINNIKNSDMSKIAELNKIIELMKLEQLNAGTPIN